MSSFHNLFSFTVAASGIILPRAPNVTPPRAQAGFGGRLWGLAGVITAAGDLRFYDGVDATGKLILDLPVAEGPLHIFPQASWRFVEGVYLQFANSAAGRVCVTFG